jgi:hypothetical protein
MTVGKYPQKTAAENSLGLQDSAFAPFETLHPNQISNLQSANSSNRE